MKSQGNRDSSPETHTGIEREIRIDSIRRLIRISWYFLILFIGAERTLTYFLLQAPKTVLLVLKICALLLNVWAAMIAFPLRRRSIPTIDQVISILALMIALIVTLQISNFKSADLYQEAGSWIFVSSSAFCATFVDLNFVGRILKFTLSYSLISALLGNVAFSPDSRLINFGFTGRLLGFFGHPNVTAFAAILLLLLCFKLRLHFVWIILSAAILFLTASFTGLLAIGIGCVVAILARILPGKITIIIGLCIVAAIPVTPFLTNNNVHTLSDLRVFSYRVEIWRWCFQQLHLSGFHSIPNIFASNLQSQSIFWTHAHNQALMDLLTGGIYKSFLTLLLLFSFLYACIKKNSGVGSSFSLIMWSTLAVSSISEVPLYMDKIDARALLLSIFLVCILSSARNEVTVRDSYRGTHG